MKILVIQLARFGDIYQTWPSLFALMERHGSEAEIHLLVRDRFMAATEGLPAAIHVHRLPTKELLEPCYLEEVGEERSLTLLQDWLADLKSLQFERVINLSFSPFSSYLTSFFESHGSLVSGYTRHSDGFLNMNDDTSAYFYAQVGVGRPNRIHLTHLFAMTCEVDLADIHLHPVFEVKDFFDGRLGNYFVLHVGASDFGKALNGRQLQDLVKTFLEVRSENLVLVGVESEKFLAEAAKPRVGSDRIIDLVGKTDLKELFSLVRHCQCLIGNDSAPIHMASLLNKPVVNLSNHHVNSDETGPFSKRFFVLDSEKLPFLSPVEWESMFSRVLSGETVQVLPSKSELSNQQWQLLQALYMGKKQPTLIPQMTAAHLSELVQLLPEIFEAAKNPQKKAHQKALNAFDEFLSLLEKSDPLLALLIRWFNTQRVRIKPGSLEEVSGATLDVLNNFYLILADWVRVLGEGFEVLSEENNRGEILDNLIKNFRLMNVGVAVGELERFLPDLLSQPSTEVQRSSLHQVKTELEGALKISDYSKIADILEYQLKPHFQNEDVLV